MLREAFFGHAHVLEVLHRLEWLRMLLVSIVSTTIHICKKYKLYHCKDEGGREGSHGPGLCQRQRKMFKGSLNSLQYLLSNEIP